MEKNSDSDLEVDALCPECGYAFKVFVDRVTSQGVFVPAADRKPECPVCGCGECRIGR